MTESTRFKINTDEDGVQAGLSGVKQAQTREKPGKCKICKAPLSVYRLGDYCGAHEHQGQMSDDKEYDKKKKKQQVNRTEKNRQRLNNKASNTPLVRWGHKRDKIVTGQWGLIKYDKFCKLEAKRIGKSVQVYQDGDMFCVD